MPFEPPSTRSRAQLPSPASARRTPYPIFDSDGTFARRIIQLLFRRTFFTTAVPSSKATWVSAPKSSGAEFNTAQEFDPQCDREPRWRSAAVRWFSESQRCTPSVPATPTGSTIVHRLKPTPTAHQQTSDVHISQHTLAARRSCDAIRPPARMENPPLCPQPCITATIFLLTKPCSKNSRDARCRTATSKHSTQAAFTCAARKASPCRPGAITISSMHKCKCMYAFNFPPFTIVWYGMVEAGRVAIESESVPDGYQAFNLHSHLSQGKYSVEKARRLLGYTPQEDVERFYRRKS